MKLKKKTTKNDHDHDNYIATPEFNKLTAENFTARLAKANLASKNDIAGLVRMKDIYDKLKNLNINVTSNKNEPNKVSKKVKAISTKGLTKYLINKLSIFDGAKHFSSEIFQDYLVFIPDEKIH